MSVATVTSKGQVTIPKDVRDHLGLEPGTRITFTRAENGDYVLTRELRSVRRLRGALAHDGPSVSVEDMDRAIAAAVADASA